MNKNFFNNSQKRLIDQSEKFIKPNNISPSNEPGINSNIDGFSSNNIIR